MNYQENFNQWLSQEKLDPTLRRELENIKDEKEIEDRFYTELEFGTGGMRGKMGVGINRMNVHTIARVTKGLGNYLKKETDNADKGVVIAYDSRHKSPEFAQTAACVLGQMGIKAYLFTELRPTPELSFAVRHLNAAAGIVITASHNPKEYNGYKVYGPDGGQMVTASADALIAEIALIKDYFDIDQTSIETGLKSGVIVMLGEEMDEAYSQAVCSCCKENLNSDLKVVYTPIHGSGNQPVRRVLKKLGYQQVSVVPEQEKPDGNFTTAPYPNPEDRSVFTLAMKLAEDLEADVIIGTDPDCDRVGVVCRDSGGEFVVLTGNQTGAAVLDVLTGFKYIGECMTEFEKSHEYTFAFGYEESYGYLAGNYARDKDAVIASALVCEMTDYYKKKGMTLYEALVALFEKHGYFEEGIEAITLDGIEGKQKINAIMEVFRSLEVSQMAGLKIKEITDYKTSICRDLALGKKKEVNLPKSNVLKFVFDDFSWFALRPSGTEPKLKIYFSATG
ncbi:MAG: phosphoglucomutase, partial [Eubacteriaceae bacterium]|nr:phosphoglucomutase [Eubacteriaceae bacterium]